MKIKNIIAISVLFAIAVGMALFGYGGITSIIITNKNSENFYNNILEISNNTQIVVLGDITPFTWDTAYFFDPYQTPQDIFKMLGFHWYGIKQQSSEGMMQVIFTNNGKVVCYCSGSGIDNGYFIDGDITKNSRILKNNNTATFVYDRELSKILGYVYIKYLIP